jgi:ribosome biogenesis GTPase
MISLEHFGWNNHFQNHLDNYPDKSFEVGRVISIKGFKYELISRRGETEAELSGKLLYTSSQDELPKVGDWVFYLAYDETGYIIDLFPRINEVYRKVAGKKNEKQILAANVDYALIVQGLDRDFNTMRLERYLVQMQNCNVSPIVVLNKADLIDSEDPYRNEINKLHRNCPVYFCSTYSGLGMQTLKEELFAEGKTYIMIGSSGVGKSSILNQILPGSLQSVMDVSGSTGKGRHTTTSRELFLLPKGGLLIDSPGMREFGLAMDDDQSGASLFPVIDDYAVECRFSDCKHINEEGCGVLKALEDGLLDADVYNSYLKLVKEQRRFELNAQDRKRLGKQFGKMTREAQEYRKKYKY